ncbi:Adagio protein 2 [Hypsizygus marmoreus]|uniref:Adagio protein 2 n=1 Tax=Hypsizygus marmoreus TaxID=39966 RepID=A0A369K345_HYPMA|nr:Adagio protein 2 [Hypsizygus marmoreus]
MNARLLCSLCIAYLFSDRVTAYDVVPRWGQAAVAINNALFIHGGKTDQYNSYGYSSAPTSNDLLYLPLSAGFDSSSPPWQLLSNTSNSASLSQNPALSWHTLSAFNTSHILLFGGQPGPNSPTVIVGSADSAAILNVYNRLQPEWLSEPVFWANQPVRRIHHSTATAPSGNVFIIGGERADDSRNAFSGHYVFQPNEPSFTRLPSDNGPPDITGHASIIMPDGRLLVFGGYSQSLNQIFPLSTIWALDTTQTPPFWTSLSVSDSSLPAPRRAFAATLLANDNVLIHGGSDALLQNNLDDGWILDTSRTPMVWTRVDALSQLGARRDHFAISYGSQVFFCFGYSDDKPADASLQIYDVAQDTFASVFTPLSPSSTPTQPPPGPSQTSKSTNTHSSTGTHGAAHPTNTGVPDPENPSDGGHPDNDNDDEGDEGDGGNHTIAVAVGTTFGILGLLIVGLGAAYYVRQRRRQKGSESRFMALRGGDHDDDDSNSAHLEGDIPPAGGFSEKQSFGGRHGWNLGVLNSLGLAGVAGAATGTRSVRNIPERRDMLADEDTREFGEWYGGRRRDGTGGSSWSLRSILGGGVRMVSRAPSNASTLGGASWREKADPFSDGAALMRDEETSYIGATRPHSQRQSSQTSTRSYHDPFADPIQEEPLEHRWDDEDPDQTPKHPYLHPVPPQLPILRTILPISQGGHALSPLSERTSQNTLSLQDPAASVSSHTNSNNSPFNTSSSRLTSHSSSENPRSPGLFSSSMATSYTPTQPMRRSDSWWARFSRSSFLDRRTSDASRNSAGMLDIRDPNPPPRLVAIEESVHSTSPDRHSPKSQASTSSQPGASTSRKASRVQGAHNKSMSSVRTADTDAIERMAGTVDVVQLMRTRSQRTASTGTNLSIDTRPESWIQHRGEDGETTEYGDRDKLTTFTSPVDMTPGEPFNEQPQTLTEASTSTSYRPLPLPLVFSPTSPEKASPSSRSGAVAARIQAYERRQSQEQEVLSPTNTKQHEEQTKKRTHGTNYGLIPRPSLFVANPDHRMIPSGDS